jgi:hypothetical protein
MISFLFCILVIVLIWRLLPRWQVSFSGPSVPQKPKRKYVKKVGHLYVPQDAECIEDISMDPGDTVITTPSGKAHGFNRGMKANIK